MIFPKVPIFHIGQLDPNEFTMSAGVNVEDETYIATFDFEEKQFEQLEGKIPRDSIEKLSIRTNG